MLSTLANSVKYIADFKQNISPLLERASAIDLSQIRVDNGISSNPASFTPASVSDQQTAQNEIENGDVDEMETEQTENNSNASFTTTTGDVVATTSESTDSTNPNGASALQLNANATAFVTVRNHNKRPASPSLGSILLPEPKQQKVSHKPLSLAEMIAKPKEKSASDPAVAVKTNLVKSIYISPFDPSIEPSHITKLLESNADLKHIVPNIKCTKLVKKNRRVNFVSFKLDVRRDQFDIVMTSSVWQSDGNVKLTVKEFVDNRGHKPKGSTKKRNNPFSQPPHTQIESNYRQPNLSQKSAKRQPQKLVKPTSRINRDQHQRQNFRQGCRKQCCNQQRPKSMLCPDHYGGNRFVHRPANRR